MLRNCWGDKNRLTPIASTNSQHCSESADKAPAEAPAAAEEVEEEEEDVDFDLLD
jgi:hypothetical protein